MVLVGLALRAQEDLAAAALREEVAVVLVDGAAPHVEGVLGGDVADDGALV